MILFQNLALKLTLKENARLRSQLRRKDKQINELLDRFVHNKVPERFLKNASQSNSTLPQQMSSYPSDAYSQAIEDAERRAESYTPPTFPVDTEDDDQLPGTGE
jgi:hypothetical protein